MLRPERCGFPLRVFRGTRITLGWYVVSAGDQGGGKSQSGDAAAAVVHTVPCLAGWANCAKAPSACPRSGSINRRGLRPSKAIILHLILSHHRRLSPCSRRRQRQLLVRWPARPSCIAGARLARGLHKRSQMCPVCWSARGSRSAVPRALPMIPDSPDNSAPRSARASVNILHGSATEASDSARSMMYVCVVHVGMRLRGHWNASTVASYVKMVRSGWPG